MSKRKPFEAVIEAFSRSPDPRSRLTFKAQVERRVRKVADLAGRDSRIEVIWDDLPTRRYLQLFADSDVCPAPSRWEGLGLHLYEATAFGMPIVTNDNPPMNELVEDGVNGLFIRGIETGRTKSGIPAFEPDLEELAAAVTRLADDELRAELARALRMRERWSWDRTRRGYAELIESVTTSSSRGRSADGSLIGDDVAQRAVEALSHVLDLVVLARPGDEDHLLRRVRREGVLHGLNWVGARPVPSRRRVRPRAPASDTASRS